MSAVPHASSIKPPQAPIVVARVTEAAWVTTAGEVERISLEEAARRVQSQPPILVHLPATARRLGREPFPAYALLQLFAFVQPARFCLPTPRGVIEAVGLTPPAALEDEALALIETARRLLARLADPARRPDPDLPAIAWTMTRAGWPWGPAVLAALGHAPGDLPAKAVGAGLDAWRRLTEWSEHAPEPPPGHHGGSDAEARARLAQLVGEGAEARPQQADYASAASAAFQPRQRAGEPAMVLAEAGTGVGKTLGYVAPASLWAEKNGGAVWISTFTRTLQHQIDHELDRLYPSPPVKALKAVVRKGRENYLCLLNLEDAARAVLMRPQDAVALGLMARWAEASRDGDMTGGDFPGWLPDLIGRSRSIGLADRRGEGVHSDRKSVV